MGASLRTTVRGAVAFVSLGLLMIVVVGCARTSGGQVATGASQAATTTVSYNALYAAEEVNDISRLTKHSSVVVSGTVTGADPVTRAQIDGAGAAGAEMVYQDFIVNVGQVLAGSKRLEGDTVRVRVLGGTKGDLTVSMGDSEPHFAVGDNVVLFLTNKPSPESPTTGGFQYIVYGDGFGSYKIRNGRAVRDAAAGQTQIDELPATDLKQKVTAAVAGQ